jgi:biopolymer transport protein ExbD
MAFGGFDQGGGARPMAEINTTPLVDVMLVLLIIFIITAPLLTHAVKVNLPQAASRAAPEEPETITVAVNAAGDLYWNTDRIAYEDLFDKLAQAARVDPQPSLHLRIDRDVRYQRVAEIMAAARNAGLSKLSFVTDPGAPPAWTLPAQTGSN